MGGDDYVIDEKRGKAWGNAYEAMCWYRDRLTALEASAQESEVRYFQWNGDDILGCDVDGLQPGQLVLVMPKPA